MKISNNDIVLVTGGTGFTGQVLVRQLCDLGCTVRVIARPSSNIDSLKTLPIQWFRGDVYDADTVNQAVEGVHYIFHVAAAFREAGIADHAYHQVHVESTQLLANAALQQSQFKRFVHVSTVGVHSHIENPPANEDAPINPGDIYQSTKAEGEQWIRDFGNRRQLPYSVIRPAPIYGPDDRRLLKVFKMAKLPMIPLLGFGKGLFHLVHVEDLARCIILAATHEKALGNVFICGNRESVTLKEMITTIAQELGKNAIFFRLPASPFFLAGYICELICKPLGIEPPIYPRRIAFFTKDRSFDTERLRDTMNFEYQFDNVTGIQQTARWYLEKGWL